MKKHVFIWSALIIMSCSSDDTPTQTEPENTAPIAEDVTFSIDEYLTSELLATVEAYDTDGDDLTFAITSQTPENSMTINASNGQLMVQTPEAFDFEQRDEVVATVEISDGSLTTTIQVTMDIIDVPGPEGNLLAYYPFNNDLDDYSGNANNASSTSATGISSTLNRFGKADSAMEFNAGYMSIPSFGENANDFSISLWVYKDSNLNQGFHSVFMSKVGTGRDYVLKFEGDEINAHYYSNSMFFHHSTMTLDLPNDTWINVILTVENGNIWSIYIDGNLAVTHTNTDLITWSNNPVMIGAYDEFEDDYFKGKIDDILVYGKTLNSAEIYEISRNRY
ncbi:cadherin domain-containing protein [Winogradskyella maritima]|uniref:LamG-like jellyroll fold domain-containing protein n=1 Tax=Winogradskyella maritima TaxID=1517766 RepID=A0ABV8AKS2_9FLAO|nr:cadherin domain-containing protein [Winogradskyella maritima]